VNVEGFVSFVAPEGRVARRPDRHESDETAE
jgi:hypothetical protein